MIPPPLTIVPTVFVHEDRMGAFRVRPFRLAVLHTTEGGEGDTRAEQLVDVCKLPGDRWVDDNNHDAGRYGASYHGVFDTDCLRSITPLDRVAFAAPGANNDGIHAVFPGVIAQTREQWLDEVSSAGMWIAAQWLLHLERTEGIPAVRLSDAEVAAGHRGYCDHGTISHVYKRSTHTDVGANFPWDILAGRIAQLRPVPPPTNPPAPKDPTAMRIFIVSVRGCRAKFIAEGTAAGHLLNCRWSGPGDAKGMQVIARHRQHPTDPAVDIVVDLADLQPVFLEGPLPFGDDRVWTLADFANPE